MRRQRRSFQLLALILGLSMIAAACGGDDDDADSGSGEEQEEDVATQEGGDLVIGAEQQPDCMDWIATCAGSSWGSWMVSYNTIPRSFDIVKQDDGTWQWEPGSLLTGEPELETDPKQVVTYSLNPDAVWSDETPITCDDYVYTWDQIANGDDIYDKTGYQDIESVECEDDQTVVVTFAKPYAAWKQLFGGQFGIFPAHLLEGKDRAAEMANGYEWSGGPWMLDGGASGWVKDTSITLVPNENYWGTKPTLDSVTFQIMADTAAEFEAFKTNTVSAIYPQPQPDAIQEIAAGIPGTKSSINAEATPNAEALWMNNEAFPFDSKDVRQAFAYAIDRDEIVAGLFGDLGVDKAMNSFNQTVLGDFGDPDAFAGYTQDLDQVDELMEGDGWTKNDDGIWEKDGRAADIVFKTTAGNARRERTQELIQEQARDAGFNVTIDNQQANDLFGTQLPQGDFTLALYAQVLTAVEPSLSSLFISSNIPTEENGFSGQNWTRTNIPEADEPLAEVDSNPDPEARSDAQAEADALLAEDATSIPLDPLPTILLWSDEIVGPADGEDNPIFGPFYDMNEWALKA